MKEKRLKARTLMSSELNDVTKAYINDGGSKTTMSDFRSVRTPATLASGKSGVSYNRKAGRNTTLGAYDGNIGANVRGWYRKNLFDSTLNPSQAD